MSHTYRNSFRHVLTPYERGYYRTRMWVDLAKMTIGLVVVVVGVQLIGVPSIGLLLAGFMSGTGAYLFITGFSRRAEDCILKYDLTHSE